MGDTALEDSEIGMEIETVMKSLKLLKGDAGKRNKKVKIVGG